MVMPAAGGALAGRCESLPQVLVALHHQHHQPQRQRFTSQNRAEASSMVQRSLFGRGYASEVIGGISEFLAGRTRANPIRPAMS
jgi:hypothetical protein